MILFYLARRSGVECACGKSVVVNFNDKPAVQSFLANTKSPEDSASQVASLIFSVLQTSIAFGH
jgi:hypothetical protein